MSYPNDSQNLKQNPYAALANQYAVPVAQASVSDRVGFIRRTYAHLAVAVIAFVLMESLALTVFWNQIETVLMPRFIGVGGLIVLGLFMAANWLASHWAHNSTSKPTQYAGLGLCVVAWTVMFMPLMYMAEKYFPGQHIILSAGVITSLVFAALTITVFVSKADFSFLRLFVSIGCIAAFALIIMSFFLGFSLGIWFAGAMVVLMAASILYTTSNILHHYHTDQHVGAALELFSSIAMMLWYVIQILMSLSSD